MKEDLDVSNIFITSPQSLIIEWDFELNPNTISTIQTLKNQLLSKDDDIQFITSAFTSILIKYKNINEEIIHKKQFIEKHLKSFKTKDFKQSKSKFFKIPVCYDDFGIDINLIANHAGLKPSEVIKIHLEQIYTLHFIGFLPGFLYLGDVDKRIQIPRRKTPRSKVEKGSVGIAENQTGIYPMNSPGGWQIIGKTPLDLFQVENLPPSLFRPGDQVQFYAVDKQEFKDLENADISLEKFISHD